MTSPEQLFALATDPQQYDSPGLDWLREGAPDSPSARFFRSYLERELSDLRGAAVIDIGCGTGHLYTLFHALGAARVVGLEPSRRMAAVARRLFPGLEVIERKLLSCKLGPEFDLAVAVMSFEHQPDLTAAFRAVRGLLGAGGKFTLAFGDSRFHLGPRFDVELEARPLTDGSVAVATRHPYGVLHDVVRPVEHYANSAAAAGFTVERTLELTPNSALFDADPRWRELEGRPVAHLWTLRAPDDRGAARRAKGGSPGPR